MKQTIKDILKIVKEPLTTEQETKRVEIIVLKYKDPEVEKKCVAHIVENTDHPFKLNLYDNRPNVSNISKIWNKLIKESTCDYVCIMDSDVFVPKGWLTKLMESIEYVALPMVTETSCSEQRASKPENKPPKKANGVFAGQCVLYKKEIFDKVGYFDEDFYLYGQDSEWAHRFNKKFKAIIRPDVLVEHVGSYSLKRKGESGEYDRELERRYAGIVYKAKTQ